MFIRRLEFFFKFGQNQKFKYKFKNSIFSDRHNPMTLNIVYCRNQVKTACIKWLKIAKRLQLMYIIYAFAINYFLNSFSTCNDHDDIPLYSIVTEVLPVL